MRRALLVLIVAALALLAIPTASPFSAQADSSLPSPTFNGAPLISSANSTATADARNSIVAITDGGKRIGSGVVVGPNLVLTSMNILNKPGVSSAIMDANGNYAGFKSIAQDDELKLVLLSAELHGMTPIKWGRGEVLRTGDKVIALGMPEDERDVIRVAGHIKAPAIAMMGGVLTTDIPIDPLLEGGAVVTPDGKAVGIITSQGFGLGQSKLGVAVTAEKARDMVQSITRAEAEADAAAAARERWKWIPRIVLLGIVALLTFGFTWFGRWYRRMEQREAGTTDTSHHTSTFKSIKEG